MQEEEQTVQHEEERRETRGGKRGRGGAEGDEKIAIYPAIVSRSYILINARYARSRPRAGERDAGLSAIRACQSLTE